MLGPRDGGGQRAGSAAVAMIRRAVLRQGGYLAGWTVCLRTARAAARSTATAKGAVRRPAPRPRAGGARRPLHFAVSEPAARISQCRGRRRTFARRHPRKGWRRQSRPAERRAVGKGADIGAHLVQDDIARRPRRPATAASEPAMPPPMMWNGSVAQCGRGYESAPPAQRYAYRPSVTGDVPSGADEDRGLRRG